MPAAASVCSLFRVLPRRLVGLLIASAALVSTFVVVPGAWASNPIVRENQQPGDLSWKAALTADNNYVHPPIEGYAGATSVRPGEGIDFHIDVPHAGRYRIEIIRLGWYGGGGGRRITCLTGTTLDPTCTADRPGSQQAPRPSPDPRTGKVAANWAVTDHLQVPSDWVSGYYLAMAILTQGSSRGRAAMLPFIVQAPAASRSSVLVVVPTNTWQAYNDWGGESLYSTPEAVEVSFDRPYRYRELFHWEYPLLRFLERNGYDVSYATDDDVDRDPSILLMHALDITAGHGEYWTHAERGAWDAARRHGVNLAFMGANTSYWQVRYKDRDRTIVSYKDFSDPEPRPALKTVAFRELAAPGPECELLGEQYRSDGLSSEDGRYFSYTVTAKAARDRWFRGTGLRPGSRLEGLVGLEFDSLVPGCRVPAATVLLRFRSGRFAADATRYRACSGSEVFAAGSLMFSWGLDSFRDPDYAPPSWPVPGGEIPALQQVMRNALADMQISHRRFDADTALNVERRGTLIRVVPQASGSFQARAYRISFTRASRLTWKRYAAARRARAVVWRASMPRSTAALVVRLSVRTGDVVDSAQYLLAPNGAGGVGPVGTRLDAASCHGDSATVLTPVFGGAATRALRVAVKMAGRVTMTVLAGGHRVAAVRALLRPHHAAILAIPAAEVPVGRASIEIAGRAGSFRLGAVRADDLDDYLASSR